jgi:tetratricopeptide (TPR) repeat protein
MRLFVTSVFLSIVSVVFLTSTVSAETSVADTQIMDRCDDDSDPAAQLEGCNAAIASGALAKADLASAYAKKGFAEEKLRGDQAASDSFQEAIRLFGELIDSNPSDAKALLNRANLYFEVSDLAHAITDYGAYLKLEPNNAQALHQRALAYNSLRDYQKVIADETEAIRLKADASFFYVVRGEAYEGLNEPQKALADYNRALSINPNNWAGLSDRARLYRRMGDYAHSVADDTQFIGLQLAWAPSAYTHRGETYILLGEYPLAVLDFDAAIARDPSDAEARNEACWTRAAYLRAELDVAREHCDKAIEIDPKEPRYFDSRGLVGLEQKRFKEAWSDYDAAIRADPTRASYWYGRAMAELGLRRVAEAQSDMAKAKAIDPKIGETFARYGIGRFIKPIG